MPIGIVQFFLKRRGFGYIQIPVTKEEFYVRQQDLVTPIADKDKVHFVVKEGKQGLFAIEVKKIVESTS
ncbi:MAG: cold-shock protein [Saprospiraceae bacterium]